MPTTSSTLVNLNMIRVGAPWNMQPRYYQQQVQQLQQQPLYNQPQLQFPHPLFSLLLGQQPSVASPLVPCPLPGPTLGAMAAAFGRF